MQSKIGKMQIKSIKQPFMLAMKNDLHLREKLASANFCSVFTIGQWIRKNNVKLTIATNLEIIKEHFDLSDTTEILETELIGDVNV
jgi:hypothetical protein